MTAGVLQVYRIFKQTYGDEKANTIVTFIMDKKKEELDEMKKTFLTKDDKIELINQIESIPEKLETKFRKIFLTKDDKIELINQIESISEKLETKFRKIFLTKDEKIELTNRITDVEIKLSDRIASLQIRLDSHFKWLIGTMVALLGLALTLHKLL